MNTHVRMWCIYQSPPDFTGMFVVREWKVSNEGRNPVASVEPTAVCHTLDQARDACRLASRGGLALAYQAFDDPRIIETWV